ncbi:hypothetical protein OA181_03575 [Acidimicrobiaceae bacterium]|nr:hypothetical protein [Acidimicrobiaceae bacterium]
MNRVLIVFLSLLIACAPSEEEIQAQIDEAVEEAVDEALEEITTTTSSTTTIPPTTTTTTTFPQSVGFIENDFVGSTIVDFEINYELISSDDVKEKDDLFSIKFHNGTYFTNYILLWFRYSGEDERNYDFRLCLSKLEKEQFNDPSELTFGCRFRFPDPPDAPMLQDGIEGTYKLQSITLTSDFSGQDYLYNPGAKQDKTLQTRYFAGPLGTRYDCNYNQNKKCKFVNTELGVLGIDEYEPIFYKNQGVSEDSFIGLTFKIENK